MELPSILGAAAPGSGAGTRIRALTSRLPRHSPLAALVIAVTGLNVGWRALESRPPHWDMAHHLSSSLIYLDGFSLADPGRFLTLYRLYPPLAYWVTDVFYAASGRQTMGVAVASNAVWITILVFATYGIGRRLWNARVGWLSVVFVLAAPMIVSSSKEYMLDLPLTAVAALSLYFVIRADGFASRRYSLLLGMACGCGVLVKWTFPLVLALPLLHIAATALADARQRHAFGRLFNLGGAAVLGFAIAGPWWVPNFIKVLAAAKMLNDPAAIMQGNPPLASLASTTWYVWNLLNVQLYVLPFLFLVVGIGFCVRKREVASRNFYPLLMIAGTFAAFTLLHHKDPRYSLPMLSPLAVVATSWLEYVSVRARGWASAVLVTYCVVAFLAISFGTSLLPKSAAFDVPSTGGLGPRSVVAFAQQGYIIGPPTNENWHQDDVFAPIRAVPRGERTFAYDGPDSIWFNKPGLEYYALRYDAVWLEDSSRARFLIRRGSAGVAPGGYVEIDGWPLPDGGTLSVYMRT